MFIYGLYDTSGELRYIGQTCLQPQKRLRQHLQPAQLRKHTHKNHWILSILENHQKPSVAILQQLHTLDDLNAAEDYWINFFKAQGCRLTNDRDGGIGMRNPSPEVRAKMSAAKKGKIPYAATLPKSAETREKLRQANLGKTHSIEARAKMSRSHKGRPCPNPEALRASRLGWKASPEQRENMKKAAQLREAKKRLNLLPVEVQ